MRSRTPSPSDWAGWTDGSHDAAYEVLGAHPTGDAWEFRVWAPGATAVSVVGDFNGWDAAPHPMQPGEHGIWSARAAAQEGQRYKYRITSEHHGVRRVFDKADPFAFHAELPPGTASVLWDLDPASAGWTDQTWLAERADRQRLDRPMSVYEVHLGSFDAYARNYRDLAWVIGDHALACGFTHVELLPVTEHPYYGSWGYQTTGYFAPTCRYGSPNDLIAMIDRFHAIGLGVILDWVPSHFPADDFALATFDGSPLFEHGDRRRGFHPDWRSLIFDYGRPEVQAFLTSSARFWLDRYHVDGLRVDGVASMLYLDYSRQPGEWTPNVHGGHEHLEAVAFLRHLNTAVFHHHPDVHMIAEESTAWPGVTRPVDAGGLGFNLKWDMGWMHDTLQFLAREPIHRRHHHDEITRRAQWAFSENYVLALSHDEVVHGKRSLIAKAPGDPWQRAATLRLLLGWQWGQPGKKLLFMGDEVAQQTEWAHEGHVPWHPDDPDYAPHAATTQAWVAALNAAYRELPALHAGDCDPAGFSWIAGDDSVNTVAVFARHAPGDPRAVAVVAANFTPSVHRGYEFGVPFGGAWVERLNSDAAAYGGSGVVNGASVDATAEPLHGHTHRIAIDLPPLGISILVPADPGEL